MQNLRSSRDSPNSNCPKLKWLEIQRAQKRSSQSPKSSSWLSQRPNSPKLTQSAQQPKLDQRRVQQPQRWFSQSPPSPRQNLANVHEVPTWISIQTSRVLIPNYFRITLSKSSRFWSWELKFPEMISQTSRIPEWYPEWLASRGKLHFVLRRG